MKQSTEKLYSSNFKPRISCMIFVFHKSHECDSMNAMSATPEMRNSLTKFCGEDIRRLPLATAVHPTTRIGFQRCHPPIKTLKHSELVLRDVAPPIYSMTIYGQASAPRLRLTLIFQFSLCLSAHAVPFIHILCYIRTEYYTCISSLSLKSNNRIAS